MPKTKNLVPPIDSHSALLWDHGDDKIVGGFSGGKDSGYSNAISEYDINENQWRVLFKNKEVDNSENSNPTIPQGRMSLGAAIHKDNLYIFGGNEGNAKLNDLWKFDPKGKEVDVY